MRLHWFLPFVRKTKAGTVRTKPGLFVRAVSLVVPARWLSNPATGKPGPIRKLLKRLGPSWSSSPFRRVVQGLCLLLFLALFFYVCFPYTAKPTKIWNGWTPVGDVQAEQGLLTVQSKEALSDPIRVGQELSLVESTASSNPTEGPAVYGRFKVTAINAKQLKLQAVGKRTDKQIGGLLDSVGPWALYEKSPEEWPTHYADNLKAKEKVPAKSLLALDPLVGISTAVAGRAWVWSLLWAAVLLVVCVFVPRGFCGYICPLGTLIDLFDWAIGKRVTRFRVADDGWWVHIKYYLLLGTMIAAMFGVLISGFVSAIPVITRGMLFTLKPFHDGFARGWHNVPPINVGEIVSIVLFFVVLGMGFFKPRFWCKYVCPSGAVFSVGNVFRAVDRKVESSCINCNKCVEICPFDAIKPDYTTRESDCTLCQSCGGVCPTDSIKFVGRLNRFSLKVVNDPPTNETALGRRGFLAAGVGLAAAVAGGTASAAGIKLAGAHINRPGAFLPVRPPGSVPEQQFLDLCIRCGECFRACPNDLLQPLGFQQGLEGLWTPAANADWAACEPSCNNCGQVCPTGAILPLTMETKSATRIGLAIINTGTCLPHAGKEECRLCVDECDKAGYHAISFENVGTQADSNGDPIEGTSRKAPVVRHDLCVGCGACQLRCYAVNVTDKKSKKDKNALQMSAIIVQAGTDPNTRESREDRHTLKDRHDRNSQIELSLEKRRKARSEAPRQQP